MKFVTRNSTFILLLALAGLGKTPQVKSQDFTRLYSFTTNASGAKSGLVLSSNILYGAAVVGGTSSKGSLFKINCDGTDFTNIYSFTPTVGSFPVPATNSDGANPASSLSIQSNRLYGTTRNGGTLGFGTVFAINIDGSGFTNLHTFDKEDGAQANGLLLASNILYGTTRTGGSSNSGTIFSLHTDGTAFTNLYSITGGNGGSFPQAGLVISGTTLYGTLFTQGSAARSNPNGGGTVFAINTDGTRFTNLYNFTGGSDEERPQAVLVLLSNTLYGTTSPGGSLSNGTVFAVNIDGTGFTTLHTFSGGNDGSGPVSSLISFGGTLYGTAGQGGASSNGTVFALNTDGTGFTILHGFSATSGLPPNATNTDGAIPAAELLLSSNLLYGTTGFGGNLGYGTLFGISLTPPQLKISQFASNVILTWPTFAPGFTLQSATNLGSSAVWQTNSPAPVLVNGQNTVTNPISGPNLFYRLSQ